MKKVHEFGDTVVFSSKSVAKVQGSSVWFDDGSTADMRQRSCINQGPGDIRFGCAPESRLETEQIEKVFAFRSGTGLFLGGGDLDFDVFPTDDTDARVVLRGTANYLRDISVHAQSQAIYVESARHHDGPTVFINGKRAGDPPEGRIELYVPECQFVQVKCGGSGVGRVHLPIARLAVEIRGAFTLNCDEVNDVNIAIQGSGTVRAERVTGKCETHISGSGDVEIVSGNLALLDVSVSGSGAVLAMAAVRHAVLSQSGSGTIIVGHVVEESRETQQGSGRIAVLRRGQ